MATLEIDRDELLSHISQFSQNINDLRIDLSADNQMMSYSIGYQTHYLRVKRTLTSGIDKAGLLIISDLAKLVTFVKKCKGQVKLKQISSGKTLYISSGNLKMNLPVTDCKSSQMTPNFEKLILNAESNEWTKFGMDNFNVHGNADLKDFKNISSLKGLIANNADFKVTANADAGEISVAVGKDHDVRIFASTSLHDSQGPSHSVYSNFGPWLMPCLGLVSPSTANVHFGQACGLVIEQDKGNEERLLIIIDQQE
tara:strand:- start:208 stop:972 length:765 start_codon:yes stop_codon:yes gene_type:complete